MREPQGLDPDAQVPAAGGRPALGDGRRSGRQEGEGGSRGGAAWTVPVSGEAKMGRVHQPIVNRAIGYFITSLTQPLVLLPSPLMTQLLLGYDSPAAALSIALPISSSSVLIREASALRICWIACARFQSFPTPEVLSRPPANIG